MPETMDKKEEKQGPAAPEAAPRPDRFRRLATASVVAAALCWGATLAYALSSVEALGPAIPRLSKGGAAARPMALGLGAVLAAGLAWVALRKFRDRFQWFKPGQGRWVRLGAFGTIGALAAFGGLAFYKLPSTASLWWADLWQQPVFGKVIAVKPVLFPALALFGTLLFVAFLLLNREKWGDFLIETEGELRKVSWPPRKEYVGSAFVVVIVMAVISVFLHFVDLGLSELMIQLKIGF
jgi:preprotein translocase SecE subunit